MNRKSEEYDKSMATSNVYNYKFIKKVKLKGVEKRYKPNRHYVFIIGVEWSDNSKYIIYRSYGEFFDFHSTLLDLFPKEAGAMRDMDRTLPYLPGRKLFTRTEVYKIANRRRFSLNEYCYNLIHQQPYIAQCTHVTHFFMAYPSDVSPPKDAKLKPEKRLEQLAALLPFNIKLLGMKKITETFGSSVDISEPLVLDQYKVVADYIPDEQNEIKLFEGESVDVVEKNENGWWFIQKDETQGWAPASYLQCQTDSQLDDENEPNFYGERYITTKAYTAMYADEISFGVCTIIEVLHKLLDGWWVVSYLGKIGYAPSTYLTPYNNPLLDYVSEVDLPSESERARLIQKASTIRAITIVKKPPPRKRSIKSNSNRSQPPRDLQIYEAMNTLHRNRKLSIPQEEKRPESNAIYQDPELINQIPSLFDDMEPPQIDSDTESEDDYEVYDEDTVDIAGHETDDSVYESIPEKEEDFPKTISTVLNRVAEGAIGQTQHKQRIAYDNRTLKDKPAATSTITSEAMPRYEGFTGESNNMDRLDEYLPLASDNDVYQNVDYHSVVTSALFQGNQAKVGHDHHHRGHSVAGDQSVHKHSLLTDSKSESFITELNKIKQGKQHTPQFGAASTKEHEILRNQVQPRKYNAIGKKSLIPVTLKKMEPKLMSDDVNDEDYDDVLDTGSVKGPRPGLSFNTEKNNNIKITSNSTARQMFEAKKHRKPEISPKPKPKHLATQSPGSQMTPNTQNKNKKSTNLLAHKQIASELISGMVQQANDNGGDTATSEARLLKPSEMRCRRSPFK